MFQETVSSVRKVFFFNSHIFFHIKRFSAVLKTSTPNALKYKKMANNVKNFTSSQKNILKSTNSEKYKFRLYRASTNDGSDF